MHIFQFPFCTRLKAGRLFDAGGLDSDSGPSGMVPRSEAGLNKREPCSSPGFFCMGSGWTVGASRLCPVTASGPLLGPGTVSGLNGRSLPELSVFVRSPYTLALGGPPSWRGGRLPTCKANFLFEQLFVDGRDILKHCTLMFGKRLVRKQNYL